MEAEGGDEDAVGTAMGGRGDDEEARGGGGVKRVRESEAVGTIARVLEDEKADAALDALTTEEAVAEARVVGTAGDAVRGDEGGSDIAIEGGDEEHSGAG